MLKSRLIYLLVCFVCSCFLVFALHLFSSWKSMHSNGFMRKLPPGQITGKGFIDLRTRSWYFSGTNEETVFLGDWSRPGRLLKVNIHTKDSCSFQITGYEKRGLYEGAYFRSDFNQLFMFDGIKPLVVQGDLNSGRLVKSCKVPFFTAGLPISSNSFALRVVKNKQNFLVKANNGTVKWSVALEKKGDGIFSTDGMLIKSDNSNSLFYVFYYRNEFLNLDTNLKALFHGKTIDTISNPQINVSRISSKNELTLSSPPLGVNKHSAASKHYLFIHSGIMADNEISSTYENGNAIDVYSVKNGKYIYSFYLGDFAGRKLTDFKVIDKVLIALFENYLYIYQLNF